MSLSMNEPEAGPPEQLSKGEGDPELEAGAPGAGGLILFSFCLRLQNHTRTTSFSMQRESANIVISSLVGFGF